MRLTTYRWLAPVPACILLQTSFGSFYSFGAFISRLNSPALTSALGLSAAVLSVSLTIAGLALHRRPPPHSPARSLALLAALFLALSGLLPVFADPLTPNPTLLVLAASALGAGYGVLYVVSLSVLQAWVPEAPGTAAGVAVAAGGAGTLAYVALNTALAAATPQNVPAAMRASAAVTTLVAVAAAALITMPPAPDWHPHHDAPADPESTASAALTEATPLIARKDRQLRAPALSARPPMGVRDMLAEPAFWLMLVCITSSVGPAFGVVLHGSRMQTVLFGVSPLVADARFFCITLVGVLGRLAVGVAVDAYAAAATARTGDALGAAFTGAKGMIVLLLAAQTAALAAAWLAIPSGGAAVFAVLLSVVYLTFCGSAVVTLCLCRAAFSPANATLAFALVGLAIGLGDIFFSSLVAGCAQRHPVDAKFVVGEHAGDYDRFFAVSLVFSCVGFGCSALLAPSDSACVPSGRGDFAVPPMPPFRRGDNGSFVSGTSSRSGSADSLTAALAMSTAPPRG